MYRAIEEIDTPGDDVVEKPHTQKGRSHSSDCWRYHVGDRGCNLDRKETGNAHHEAKNAL